MKARTEDDILSRAPIVVKLGDKDYSIPLLAVMAQREWRKKLFAELAPLLEAFNFTVDGKSMASGLTAALLNFPEKLCDLVFLYRQYGFALASLADVPDEEIHAAFLALIAKKPLAEAPDFPHSVILAKATEEQIASAFSAVMAVAFPFIPQLGMVTTLLRSVPTATTTLQ
jgi:hypothetical protein